MFHNNLRQIKFKRAVRGLVSSGNEYNRRGVIALAEIPIIVKVVDGILSYNDTSREHQHVIKVVKKSDDAGITLNHGKFLFARNELNYCGFRVTEKGYSTNDLKMNAIKKFSRYENITDLRSFMGLVNHLGASHLKSPLRPNPL